MTYYSKHTQERKEYAKKYYQSHKEKKLAYTKLYKQQHKERISEYNHEYYLRVTKQKRIDKKAKNLLQKA